MAGRLGFAAGGAVLTVLKSLLVGASDGNPSTINAEKLAIPDGTGCHSAEQLADKASRSW